MLRRPNRIIFTIVLTLALAVGAAPAAWARFDLNPPPPSSSTPSSDTSASICSETCSGAGYLLSRATVSTTSAPTSSAPRSEVVSGNGYGPSSVAPTVVHVSAPSSFDWGDAGIGAGGALALMVLAAAGALAVTNGRRRGSRSSAQPTT
jgi:hypothetical protein